MNPIHFRRRKKLAVTTFIHWFRRDLRISDNIALARAVAEADRVVPVYILSDWKSHHRWTGPNRQAFLCGCLESLAANLGHLGGELIIRRGKAPEVLRDLIRETGARGVTFNRDPDPFGRKVEAGVEKVMESLGLRVIACMDTMVHEPGAVRTAAGEPYRVFTPFAKAWRRLELPGIVARPGKLATPRGIRNRKTPALSDWGLKEAADIPAAGEKAARKRLADFLQHGVADYGRLRDAPAAAGTSRLSQDLRFGLLSPREVFRQCTEAAEAAPRGARQSLEKFITELIWREFYLQILWHFPEVLEKEFNPKFRSLEWPGGAAALERWQAGETGFPIVDAGMRQLLATGYMHNRLRMITAMFLTKDLHVDWREGEQWFMRQLVDGEIASNNGGWQWSAGTGADAAPYFRIQNPWLQSKRHDPDGAYIKRWVPELRDVETERLHQPPPQGESLARKYPPPMVDHNHERQRTLELFSEV